MELSRVAKPVIGTTVCQSSPLALWGSTCYSIYLFLGNRSRALVSFGTMLSALES
jgi:hypothetical protein